MKEKEFQVILEDIRSQFKTFGEGLGIVSDDLKELKGDIKSVKGRLNDLELHIKSIELTQSTFKNEFKDLKGRLTSIEEELKLIREGIKTKAEKEEFEALEKRVSLIGKKLTI